MRVGRAKKIQTIMLASAPERRSAGDNEFVNFGGRTKAYGNLIRTVA
jgi:hypothetical protein